MGCGFEFSSVEPGRPLGFFGPVVMSESVVVHPLTMPESANQPDSCHRQPVPEESHTPAPFSNREYAPRCGVWRGFPALAVPSPDDLAGTPTPPQRPFYSADLHHGSRPPVWTLPDGSVIPTYIGESRHEHDPTPFITNARNPSTIAAVMVTATQVTVTPIMNDIKEQATCIIRYSYV